MQAMPDKALPVPASVIWADSNRSFRSCPPGPLTGNDPHPRQARRRYRPWKNDLRPSKTPGSSKIQSRYNGAEVAARKSALAAADQFRLGTDHHSEQWQHDQVDAKSHERDNVAACWTGCVAPAAGHGPNAMSACPPPDRWSSPLPGLDGGVLGLLSAACCHLRLPHMCIIVQPSPHRSPPRAVPSTAPATGFARGFGSGQTAGARSSSSAGCCPLRSESCSLPAATSA